MRWNWTQDDWPNFRYDSAAVEPLERRFLLSSGEILGAVRHVTGEERDRFRVELMHRKLDCVLFEAIRQLLPERSWSPTTSTSWK